MRKEKYIQLPPIPEELDGSVPDKDIQRMIGESYDLTKGKKK